MDFLTFQGDVDIFRIDSIPKTATPLKNDKTVMYGEATGHHHSFKSGQVVVYQPAQGDSVTTARGETAMVQKYIEVKEDAVLAHQEHTEQVIPKGNYLILQEREYNVLDNEIKNVMD